MSNYTHEFCKKVLAVFNDRRKSNTDIEEIKEELNENHRPGRHVLSFALLVNGGLSSQFTRYLDELDASAELREILTDEHGFPVSADALDLHFLRLDVNKLKAAVEQLQEEVNPQLNSKPA